MNCEEVQNKLYEVEPASLGGDPGPEVSAHLLTCEACRDVAATLNSAHLGARFSYSALTSAVPPEVVANRASSDTPVLELTSRLRPGRVWWVVGTSVAAGLGFVLLARGLPQDPAPAAQSATTGTPTESALLSLSVPEGKNAAVMATNNPDITVILFY